MRTESIKLYKKRYRVIQNKLHRCFLMTVVALILEVFLLSCQPVGATPEIEADGSLPMVFSSRPLDSGQIGHMMASMDMGQRIGQTLLVHLPWVARGEAGWKLDERRRSFIRDLQPGGIVLYAQHMGTAAQILELVKDLRALCVVPPFIAVDEEGGRVSRLSTAKGLKATRIPPAKILASAGRAAVSGAYATIGRELWTLGINMDFAPVADLGFPESDSVIGDRSFGTDADVVAEMVVAAVDGLQTNGVCAVIKHFPGHGRSAGDSHFGKQVVQADWRTLSSQDLVPFRKAIAGEVGGMMTAHVEFPRIDPASRPVSLSPVLLQEKLRGELGYQGLIITDALDMQGVLAVDSPEDIAVASLAAGVDMLLSPEDPARVAAAVAAAIKEKRLEAKTVDEACMRVLAAKNRFGLFDPAAGIRPAIMAKALIGSESSRRRIGDLVAGQGWKASD
jgi:beta-N-acetylhexosaminidase